MDKNDKWGQSNSREQTSQRVVSTRKGGLCRMTRGLDHEGVSTAKVVFAKRLEVLNMRASQRRGKSSGEGIERKGRS